MHRHQRIRSFVETLWIWYAANKRSLPWRDLHIDDPEERGYRILVSEVMLQQTQVSRCIGAYRNFLELFPDMRSLARAGNRDVLLAWRGMGYNSRALRLRDAVRVIVAEHAGVFPRTFEELRRIPGLGPYTAAAVRNFAWNLPTPCIDTNIRRILHRTFVGPEHPDGTWKKNDRWLLGLAEDVLEAALAPMKFEARNSNLFRASNFVLRISNYPRTAADWHAALMDFGSLVQTKRNPKWDTCPLTERGIMRTTRRSYERVMRKAERRTSPAHRSLGEGGPVHRSLGEGGKAESVQREPGRYVGSAYIPNRIFRGRIVDELRDEPGGLMLEDIGARVCLDWSPDEHGDWLRSLTDKLVKDALLERRGKRFVLSTL